MQGPVDFQISSGGQRVPNKISSRTLSGEWIGGGQGLLLKLQHRCLGHSGSPLMLQELQHWLCSCKGTMSCFRRAGRTSGLPEMKSYNMGLSGPVCGKEQKGCLFTFHIRPQRPCKGGRFPRGKDTCGVLQDTQYLLAFSEALWGPLACLSSLQPIRGTLLNKALSLFWLSFLAQQCPEYAPKLHGLHPPPCV